MTILVWIVICAENDAFREIKKLEVGPPFWLVEESAICTNRNFDMLKRSQIAFKSILCGK